MFKKTKKEVAFNSKVEKLSKNELSNVIGGDGSGDPTTTPDDGKAKPKGQVSTTWDLFTNTK